MLSCLQVKRSSCVQDFKESFAEIKESGNIDFESVNCFPWDTLMMLAPYHYNEQIKEETGIVLPNNLSKPHSDHAYFVFINHNQVQEIITISTEQFDLIQYIRQRAFSRSYILWDRENLKDLDF